MKTTLRFLGLTILCLVWAATAGAQTSTTASDEPTRPALPTFDGDAGLWYVPTADLLAKGAYMGSLYRQGLNYVPTSLERLRTASTDARNFSRPSKSSRASTAILARSTRTTPTSAA